MASLALKSSASAFSGLSLSRSCECKPAQSRAACRSNRGVVVRASANGETIVTRRSLSVAAAAVIALSNQPSALAARRGAGRAEEVKEKKPEDDPKLSALEKRALVKARQLEELKAKVAKEKSKASDAAKPANIESNFASALDKGKEVVDKPANIESNFASALEKGKEVVDKPANIESNFASALDKGKEVVDALPIGGSD